MGAFAQFWDSQSLPDHVSLVRDRIQKSLSDPETKRLAQRIIDARPDELVQGVPLVYAWGMQHQLAENISTLEKATAKLDQINAIWNFVVLNVEYVPDGIVGDAPEVMQTAELVLDGRRGDCDCMVILLSSLLQAIGFDTACVIISADDPDHWQHIYTLVRYGKQWISLDPVIPGAVPGYEYDGAIAAEEFALK